jgi:hypothetical protein
MFGPLRFSADPNLVKDSIWVVTGSPPKLKANEDFVGGTTYIEIRKSDCRILKCYHEK